MDKLRTRQESESATHALIVALAHCFPNGFPGLDKLDYHPVDNAELTAIVLACQCGEARLTGHIVERTEGAIEGMHLVGAIDANAIAAKFTKGDYMPAWT